MIIIQWVQEFLYWLTNAVTYFVPFLEPGAPISNPTEKAHIVILSPSFTGPILYLKEKKYFEKRGFLTHVVNFSTEMRNLDTAALQLKAVIEQFKPEPICLVGTSAAGLVSYEYLNTLGGWEDVDTFIALATPFKGSPMAYTHFHTKTGRQLVPNSRYIQKIAGIKPQHLDRMYCVVAKRDELVPRQSSTFPGAKLLEIPVVGHVRLHAYSPKTFDTIIAIAKGELQA